MQPSILTYHKEKYNLHLFQTFQLGNYIQTYDNNNDNDNGSYNGFLSVTGYLYTLN